MSDQNINPLQTQFRFKLAQFEQSLKQRERYQSIAEVEHDYNLLTQLSGQAQTIAQTTQAIEPIQQVLALSHLISGHDAPTIENSISLHRA